jgi:CheY-like chemotaxis protein
MKKTIVVADRDASLQHAFMTVFSKAHFEIIHAANGKEVERIAEKMNPDVYIVNVDLPKTNGIEVYKKLQKQKLLEKASFFFLKDESDTTELLGYQADGVIEKPINFFRVYETVTREDEAIELTDLVDDEPDVGRQPERKEPVGKDVGFTALPDEASERPQPRQEEKPASDRKAPSDAGSAGDESIFSALTDEEMKSSIRQIGARLAAELEAPSATEAAPVATEEPGTTEAALTGAVPVENRAEVDEPPPARIREEKATIEEEISRVAEEEARMQEETKHPDAFGSRLRDVMDNLATGHGMTLADAMGGVEEMGEGQSELEAQFKTVLNQAMEEAALKLSARLAPVLTRYVEDYVKRMLLEIAEKVIREEIEKLLKESAE